jgi:hypothetical protein
MKLINCNQAEYNENDFKKVELLRKSWVKTDIPYSYLKLFDLSYKIFYTIVDDNS